MIKIENDDQLNDLAAAISKLRDVNEIKSFLRDMFTSSELMTIVLRWKVAQMLDDGIPYTEIEKKTGASSATIAKVSEFLKYGFNGYRLMLDRKKKR